MKKIRSELVYLPGIVLLFSVIAFSMSCERPLGDCSVICRCGTSTSYCTTTWVSDNVTERQCDNIIEGGTNSYDCTCNNCTGNWVSY